MGPQFSGIMKKNDRDYLQSFVCEWKKRCERRERRGEPVQVGGDRTYAVIKDVLKKCKVTF